jgi:hypothetical protein
VEPRIQAFNSESSNSSPDLSKLQTLLDELMDGFSEDKVTQLKIETTKVLLVYESSYNQTPVATLEKIDI